MGKETRRELFGNLGRLSLLPFARELGRFLPNLETEQNPLEPGNVVRDLEGKTFVVKQELNTRGTPILVRYFIPDFFFWKESVGYREKVSYASYSQLSSIPIAEVPRGETVPHWDGTVKRHNREGGIKFTFITGLGSESGGSDFDKIKQVLKEQGYDEQDFLESTYRIDPRKDQLGVSFSTVDSTQHPPKSLETMDRLLSLWKKQFPLEKIWLIGHSQGGWLAYELARRHPDAVIGFISLSGAVNGANPTPLPAPIEAALAQIFRGEGGRFFIDRGADSSIPGIVSSEVQKLNEKGVITAFAASTNDTIVDPQHALVATAKKTLLVPMESWIYADTVQKNLQQSCLDPSCLEPDFASPISDSSAQLQYLGAHWAVFQDQSSVDFVATTIAESTPTPFSQEELKKQAELEEQLAKERAELLGKKPWVAKLPIVGPTYTFVYNEQGEKTVVSLSPRPPIYEETKEDVLQEAKDDALKKMRKLGIDPEKENIGWVVKD